MSTCHTDETKLYKKALAHGWHVTHTITCYPAEEGPKSKRAERYEVMLIDLDPLGIEDITPAFTWEEFILGQFARWGVDVEGGHWTLDHEPLPIGWAVNIQKAK